MRYVFGDFELDGDGRQLRRRATSGGAIPIEAQPKVLALLRALVGSAPSVVTRSELLDTVWRGHVVSASAINTVVKTLRQVLDDDDQRFVRTVHGIGYAFVAPVRCEQPARAVLHDARQRLFVGREAELARLAGWLDPARSEDDAGLFWVHGVGGIGKTTLLHQLEAIALERDVPVVTISCAHVRPSPEAVLHAVASSVGAWDTSALVARLGGHPRGLLVFDGYEALLGVDDWLRERFVQRLPHGWRLVLSGRSPPGVRWRADPTWSRAVEIHLGDLTPTEADALLARRGVERPERARIVRFAGGHPLALVLAMESMGRGGRFAAPTTSAGVDVVPSLLDWFVREAPTARHREALDCLAVVDALDESLLAAMLNDEEASVTCFDWLAGLGMVRARPEGLVLHDLAKKTLLANLAWRNGARLGGLAERASMKLLADLETAAPGPRRRRLAESLWRIFGLHPTIAPLVSLAESSGTPTAEEIEVIAEHVERFEGRSGLEALRYQLACDETVARVLRGPEGDMSAYVIRVDVRPGDAEARAKDPVLRELDSVLGDASTAYSVLRWFADCRAYHDVTPVSIACHVLNSGDHLGTLDRDVGYSFVLVSNPAAWEPMVRLAGFGRRTESGVDGDRLAVFAHDWREYPLTSWLREFMQRVIERLSTGAPLDLGLR